jgi:protein deglycase
MPMSAPTVLVILAEGFEEMEAVTPVDLLRRAGAVVTVASLEPGIHVTGRNGVTLHADTNLDAVGNAPFDCVLLPGGPGVGHLLTDARVLERLQQQAGANGWIAAICAAPLVVNAAGLLKGLRYTAHLSVSAELPALLAGERAVADGRLITSRGAGTSLDFGLLIIAKLFSPEMAAEVALSICA